jgi:hypothetical protein
MRAMGEKYRVAFANLQLVVLRECDRWALRISDLNGREILYGATSATAAAAKTAAVEWALNRLFGPGHRKDSAGLAEGLAWEAVPQE